MEATISPASVGALLGAMLVLALIPGVSVLAVTARAVAGGFSHGLFTTLGIVAGDIVFILAAVYGLAFVAEAMGEQFRLVKLLGGAYLLWLGISLWRAEARAAVTRTVGESSWRSSFLSGLLITLGDQKAILFYLGFFPAFVDLAAMTALDTLIVVASAALGVGGAKLVYAFLAARAGRLLDNRRALRGINGLAAGVMVAVGGVLLFAAVSGG